METEIILACKGDNIYMRVNYDPINAKAGYIGTALEDQQLHSTTLFCSMNLLPTGVESALSNNWITAKKVIIPVSCLDVLKKDHDPRLQSRFRPLYVPTCT